MSSSKESKTIFKYVRSSPIPGQKNLIETLGKETLESDPPFTVKDLKKAIPAHCFERDYMTSFMHLGWDLARVFILFNVAYYVHYHLNLPLILSIPFWIVYWAVQGTIMTGVWVIAHECGHQAFSKYRWLNDTVGLVLHTALLVPYFSWRITHAAHHYYTGNFEKDEVHVPNLKEDVELSLPWSVSTAIISFLKHVLIGWPAYLFANISSNRIYKDQHVDHFSPWSPLFRKEDRIFVIINDIALVLFCALLLVVYSYHGFVFLLKLYFVPYLIVNAWLVLITKLQHTSPDAPYFEDKDWGWLRGQLTTIDRTFGSVLDETLHHINDTHLVHHIFSKIPFYHAKEATESIKKVVGKYYRYNDAPLWKQIWNVFSECVYIHKDGKAYWFYKE